MSTRQKQQKLCRNGKIKKKGLAPYKYYLTKREIIKKRTQNK